MKRKYKVVWRMAGTDAKQRCAGTYSTLRRAIQRGAALQQQEPLALVRIMEGDNVKGILSA